MRLRSQIAGLCLAAFAVAAQARPFTVEDLLSAEEFGQVGFDPTGRWLVFEQFRGQAQSGPFDQDVYSGYRRGRIHLVDLQGGGAPTMLAAGPDEGHVAGPFSPDGSRLVVLRLKGRAWDIGVFTLATRRVDWLGVTPELGQLGQTIAWRNSSTLIIAARPDGDAPLRLRTGRQWREELGRLWAATGVGEQPAMAVIGSGRYRGVRPMAAAGSLLEVDLARGTVRRLAEGEFYDLELSPDGSQVAAMARLEDLAPSSKELMRVASPSRRRNLMVVDLVSGRSRLPCPDCDLATHLISWSPAAPELLVYGRRQGDTWRQARPLRLAAAGGVRDIPLGDLKVTLSYTSEGYEIAPAGWLKGDPIVFAHRAAEGRSDWHRVAKGGPLPLTAALAAPEPMLVAKDEDGLSVMSAGVVWRVTPGGQATRTPAQGAAAGRSGPGLSSRQALNVTPRLGWTRSQGTAVATTYVSTEGRSFKVEAQGGRVLQTVPGAAGAAVIRRLADGTMGLEFVDPRGRRRTLMTLNSAMAEVSFARTMPLTSPGEGGSVLRHWLLLPAKSTDKARPPLIVIPYPGATYEQPPEPYGRGVGRFSANAEVLAAAGYAVLIPSLPRDPARLEPGQDIARQILAVVDLAGATGLVDTDRLAVMGHSFGGYGSLMAATQSGRFKAVIASAAPSNLTSVRGAFDPHHAVRPEDGLELNPNYGWSELGQGHLKASPWEDPAKYLRNSPLFAVDRITAPVLLIHGDGDFVRLSQAQEMFSALNRLDKDAELITVFGEGHIVSSPANVREVHRRVIAWLDRVFGRGPDAQRSGAGRP